MRHRSGKALRKNFAREHRLLLVLGVVLVLAALGMSMCEPSADRLGGAPALGTGSVYSTGGGDA
jgi:type II secretory pathway component PulM